jgi:hypothetical protein
MKTTPWFDRQFTFGQPEGMLPFFLERLHGTIARIEHKVKDISEDVLSHKLDGKWSIKQNIGHLAEVDEIALKRLHEIKTGISPMSPAVFEPRHDYNAGTIANVLDYFTENRLSNISAYKNISNEDIIKSSLHPRLKVHMTPIDLAYFDAEHDDHHLVRINEILRTLLS